MPGIGITLSPAFSGAIGTALRQGDDVSYGQGFMVDENGDRMVDENGAFLTSQIAPAYSVIKDAAAARGIKFGVAAPRASLTTAGSLVQQQFSLLGWDGAFKPNNIQDVQGVFTWSSVDDAIAYSSANSMPWRLHLLNYPAHDMAWVNGSTVTAATWRAQIDAHFEAVASHLAAFGANGRPTSIDVTNELADGAETDGFARNTWYNAGGRAAFAYMFQKARQLWPTTPLYLCQDLQEQNVVYFSDRRVSFLKIIDYLQSVGAPIDGVNLQGHLGWNRPWDPVAFKQHLYAIKNRGLKVIVGELDVQYAVEDGTSYSSFPDYYHDKRIAEIVAQYMDIIVPLIDGGELVMWELSDADTPWGAAQRPCLYDDNLVVKPAYYRALLESFLST